MKFFFFYIFFYEIFFFYNFFAVNIFLSYFFWRKFFFHKNISFVFDFCEIMYFAKFYIRNFGYCEFFVFQFWCIEKKNCKLFCNFFSAMNVNTKFENVSFLKKSKIFSFSHFPFFLFFETSLIVY